MVGTRRMHDDELTVDADLAGRLIAAQLPEWEGLGDTAAPALGDDNAMFRLGDDMVVRLPRIEWAVGQVEKDMKWLPVLAPHLPLAIPELLDRGAPSDEYPWGWGVYRWLEGEVLPADRVEEALLAERDLARSLLALREIDASGGPPACWKAAMQGSPSAPCTTRAPPPHTR